MMGRKSRFLLVAAVYVALTLLATYPVWLRVFDHVPISNGDPLLNTWTMAWDVHALLTDPLNLFNANIFFPLKGTLAYSEHLLAPAVLQMPLLLLSGEPILVYNLSYLATFGLSAIGLYLLVSFYTGSRMAGFVAGVAFAFNARRAVDLEHFPLLSVQWLPFTILFLERFLLSGRKRDLVCFVLFLDISLLTNWHVAAFTLAAVSIVVVCSWLTRPVGIARHRWGLMGLGLLVAALVMVPVVRAYMGVWADLDRARPPTAALFFSGRLTDYLAATSLNRLFGQATAVFRARPDFNGETHLFLGIVLPVLAALSVAVFGDKSNEATGKIKKRRVLLYWLLLGVALAFTFGPALHLSALGLDIPPPYTLAQNLIPGFSLMRVPARWIILAMFALSVLLGDAVKWIIFRKGEASWRATSFAIIAGFAIFAEGYSAPIPLSRVGSLKEQPQVYSWLAQQRGGFAILEIPLYSWPRKVEYPEAKRMYASTLHWKRLVNGYSGFTPPSYRAFDEQTFDFPSTRALEAIRGMGQQGLRYLIVHSTEWQFDTQKWESEGRWQAEASVVLWPVFAAQGDYVYEVNPFGEVLLTDQEKITDPDWRRRLPHLVNADFSGELVLLAYQVSEGAEAAPVLTLFWKAIRRPVIDYTVFVHLLDQGGDKVAQGDSQPVGGHLPTTGWEPGQVVRDEHPLTILTKDVTAGQSFAVGLYQLSTMERLPVVDARGLITDTQVILMR